MNNQFRAINRNATMSHIPKFREASYLPRKSTSSLAGNEGTSLSFGIWETTQGGRSLRNKNGLLSKFNFVFPILLFWVLEVQFYRNRTIRCIPHCITLDFVTRLFSM
jgi:hypothetical protein